MRMNQDMFNQLGGNLDCISTYVTFTHPLFAQEFSSNHLGENVIIHAS